MNALTKERCDISTILAYGATDASIVIHPSTGKSVPFGSLSRAEQDEVAINIDIDRIILAKEKDITAKVELVLNHIGVQ